MSPTDIDIRMKNIRRNDKRVDDKPTTSADAT